MRRPRPCGSTSGDRREIGLRRQRAEDAIEQLAGRRGVDVADDGDLELVARQHAPGIGAQIVGGDVRDGFERAVAAAPVGMVGEGGLPPACGWRCCSGWWSRAAAPAIIWARTRSTASASKRGSVERQPQQVEGFVAVLVQHAQRAAEIVAAGAEAQLDRVLLEPLLERLGVEVAGAFVEQAAARLADAGLAGGVLAGAADGTRS